MSESDGPSASKTGMAESETDERETTDSAATDTRTDEQSTPTSVPALERAEPLLLVAVGGFAGAVLRHAVAVALSTTAALPDGLPWGTLGVNVAGSFALGFLLFEAELTGRLGARTRLLLGTGFLSSFTTYSTFAVQTVALSPSWAVANVGANYALCFAAVLAGRFAVRSLAGSEVTR